MFIDANLEMSSAQALTATAASTNYIDLTVDRDIGVGSMMYWVVHVVVAADDTTGDETYVAALETDDNTSFSSVTQLASFTIPRGTAAGTKYWIGFPNNNERYIRTNYTLGGTTPTVTLDSYLTSEHPEAWKSLPNAI